MTASFVTMAELLYDWKLHRDYDCITVWLKALWLWMNYCMTEICIVTMTVLLYDFKYCDYSCITVWLKASWLWLYYCTTLSILTMTVLLYDFSNVTMTVLQNDWKHCDYDCMPVWPMTVWL